jgi:hypothetical protein
MRTIIQASVDHLLAKAGQYSRQPSRNSFNFARLAHASTKILRPTQQVAEEII